jgi:hypothetical protein
MSKFRVFTGNPKDPGIEEIEAYSISIDQYGNLTIKMQFADGYLVGAAYAKDYWHKVERVKEAQKSNIEKAGT